MKEKITHEKFQQLFDEIVIRFAEKQTTKIWHQMAMEWNETSVFLNWLADNPKTDKATALMMYWKSAPRYHKQFNDREDVLKKQSRAVAGFDFVEKIEKNYLNGFYETQNFEFNPKNDEQGYDWTSEYQDKPKVREIPEMMFEQLIGEQVKEPENFIEGMPPELYDLQDELYERYDAV
ncbi:MAG: DUF4274 domain-containing protein [Chryseobacterium sp.]|nr:DUF4274 domain-containing protein [Chryseobacterium sp.]OJX33640.1 MAG: hypothetical protein BGO86_15930 [Chryseobacterium sp. 36-9]